MISRFLIPLLSLLLVAGCASNKALFQDDFAGKPDARWSWLREHREAWRVGSHGLEVHIEPGNMWGKANDAKNILIRPAPDAADGAIEITATVENHPTAQYEQADLVWYYNDGHMVKLGEELVDGKLSIVMGREENDRTRTIKILPLSQNTVTLRLTVRAGKIHGEFRVQGSTNWQEVGECDLPAPTGVAPKISLQFYQGPADAEHWARVSEFRVRKFSP